MADFSPPRELGSLFWATEKHLHLAPHFRNFSAQILTSTAGALLATQLYPKEARNSDDFQPNFMTALIIFHFSSRPAAGLTLTGGANYTRKTETALD